MQHSSGFGTVWSVQTFRRNLLDPCSEGGGQYPSETFVPGYQTLRRRNPEHRNVWQCRYCSGSRGIAGHIFKFKFVASWTLFQYFQWRVTYLVLFTVYQRHVAVNGVVTLWI
jgi:hypothetical protein